MIGDLPLQNSQTRFKTETTSKHLLNFYYSGAMLLSHAWRRNRICLTAAASLKCVQQEA